MWLPCCLFSLCLGVADPSAPRLTPAPPGQLEPQPAEPPFWPRRQQLGPALPPNPRATNQVTLRCRSDQSDREWLRQQLVGQKPPQAWLIWRVRLDDSPGAITLDDFDPDHDYQEIALGSFSAGRLVVEAEVKTGPHIWLEGTAILYLTGIGNRYLDLNLKRSTTHLTLLLIDLPPLPTGQLSAQKRLTCLSDQNQTDRSTVVECRLVPGTRGGVVKIDGLSPGRWIGQLTICGPTGQPLISTLFSCLILNTETIEVLDWGNRYNRYAFASADTCRRFFIGNQTGQQIDSRPVLCYSTGHRTYTICPSNC